MSKSPTLNHFFQMCKSLSGDKLAVIFLHCGQHGQIDRMELKNPDEDLLLMGIVP